MGRVLGRTQSCAAVEKAATWHGAERRTAVLGSGAG